MPAMQRMDKPIFSRTTIIYGPLRILSQTKKATYSSESGTSAMFFSPAAFFSV